MKTEVLANFADMLTIFSDAAVTVVNGSRSAQGLVQYGVNAEFGSELTEKTTGECVVPSDDIGELSFAQTVTIAGQTAYVSAQPRKANMGLTVFQFQHTAPVTEATE